jgi:hypothetical protein
VNIEHNAKASKDRTNIFVDEVFRITEETGKKIAEWDTAYLDETYYPKYYIETKKSSFVEKLPLCSPHCSLENWKKDQKK